MYALRIRVAGRLSLDLLYVLRARSTSGAGKRPASDCAGEPLTSGEGAIGPKHPDPEQESLYPTKRPRPNQGATASEAWPQAVNGVCELGRAFSDVATSADCDVVARADCHVMTNVVRTNLFGARNLH